MLQWGIRSEVPTYRRDDERRQTFNEHTDQAVLTGTTPLRSRVMMCSRHSGKAWSSA